MAVWQDIPGVGFFSMARDLEAFIARRPEAVYTIDSSDRGSSPGTFWPNKIKQAANFAQALPLAMQIYLAHRPQPAGALAALARRLPDEYRRPVLSWLPHARLEVRAVLRRQTGWG
jgi:hypothetical protein